MDSNATQACIRAGYSEDTAYSIGSENLRKPEIEKYIKKLQAETAKSLGVTKERIINELAKLAFLDPRRAFDANSRLIAIKSIPADVAAALTSVEVDELWAMGPDGREQVGDTKKIKFVDKKGALDSLAKLLGFNAAEKTELSGMLGVIWNETKNYDSVQKANEGS